MRNQCCLRVAGLSVLFEADCPIAKSEEFAPFESEVKDPDILVTICKSKEKPKLPEKTLYKDMFYAVARRDDGCLQKFFYGNADDHNECVVATYDQNNKHVIIEYPDTVRYKQLTLTGCFYWLGFEAFLLQRDKLCLHASCVDTHLGGILFSGVSGIGKSTQADLWCKFRGARQINGDRPILSKENRGWKAWGSPYAGSSRCYVNDSCDIAAIVLLKQADHCKVRRLTPAEAFRGVWQGLTVRTWDTFFVEAASALLAELVVPIPVYEFSCTPDEHAVEVLEEELRKEKR